MATTTHRYPAREGARFANATSLVVVTCTCGMPFAIPEQLERSALEHRGPKGWQITCPLGHSWHYTGENTEERLTRELKLARDSVARERARHDQTKASLTGTKAAATRARNERDRIKARVVAGVCPCCTRTFKQLARHMKAKHPDYEAAS